MLGIGVGIDYALLIVTRYRAALAAGREPRDAIGEAIAHRGALGRSSPARPSSSRCSACS